MKMKTIERVIEILANCLEMPASKSEFSADTNLIEDTQLDSIKMINFMLDIENAFDIEIDFDGLDMTNLHSISRFADFILEQKSINSTV